MNAKKSKFSILGVATVLLLLTFSSCSKYEEGPSISLRTKTARLTGEWNMTKIDHASPESGWKYVMEFEKDGDFSLVISFDGDSEVYLGEWEWTNDKESIEVVIDGDDPEEWDITRLTNDEFWFEDTSNIEYECVKE